MCCDAVLRYALLCHGVVCYNTVCHDVVSYARMCYVRWCGGGAGADTQGLSPDLGIWRLRYAGRAGREVCS